MIKLYRIAKNTCFVILFSGEVGKGVDNLYGACRR